LLLLLLLLLLLSFCEVDASRSISFLSASSKKTQQLEPVSMQYKVCVHVHVYLRERVCM
jgi:hypothetical protein